MGVTTKPVTWFVAAAIAATMLLLQPVCAEEENKPVVAAESEQTEAAMAARGKSLYEEHCSHCHGFKMVNPGIIAYDLRQFPHNDKTRFVHSVTTGKNGRMPAWGDVLSAADIDELWAYVKTGGTQ